MRYLLVAFLVSCLGSVLVIRFFCFRAVCDTCKGVQKFHQGSVPRVGGCAIYLSVWIVGGLFLLSGKPFAVEFLKVMVASVPLFVSGLVEDLTKRVRPFVRLVAGFFSGALAYFLVPAQVVRVNVPGIDALLRVPVVSLLFTSFAVAGVSHAFNIVDGFNGLASGVAMLVFGAYAYVSFLLHDHFLLYLSLVMLFAVLGFFIWNYPFGFIFLGDCGAYLLGYVSAVVGMLLVERHPQVSPWFPLLLVIYPVWETLFSIYRRRFLRGVAPDLPDAMHFHTLIYRRLVKMTFGSEVDALKRNAFTSPYLWIMELICLIPAVLFWDKTSVLVVFVVGFIVFYTWLYFRIVMFKTPSFLVRKYK